MANFFVAPALTLLYIAVANGAVTFNNAYIQNVKSGRCVTIQKDVLLDPLQADECTCGIYQFWRIEKDEYIMNEDSMIMYMDQLYGKPANGETVGIYAITGLPWQKWNIFKFNDGTYSLSEKQNHKCLKQGGGGKLVHWECDDDDLSQRWKIIKDPCGKRPSTKEPFQLRNPKTGLCAIILNDKDADYAPAGTHKCSCSNQQHYWKFHPFIEHNLQSQGVNKRCMANWEVTYPTLYPGITQCGCAANYFHRWSLLPSGLQNGNHRLVSQMSGRCVAVKGNESGTPLRYKDCDLADEDQQWELYDQCAADIAPPPTPAPTPPPTQPPTQPPRPTNVIPTEYKYFFDVGNMNWLTLERYYMLAGGRWDSTTQSWYTAYGQQIKPNTAEWTKYFGNATPGLLNAFFQNGKTTWNEVFGWMNGDFFEVWTDWKTQVPTPPPQPKNVIPNYQTTYFSSTQMNWLNPQRYWMLNGGRWDSVNQVWKTPYGGDIRPNTEAWKIHFGDASPSLLNALFPNGQSFKDTFSWMTPEFFDVWTSWKTTPVPQPQPQPQPLPKDAIPSNLVSHFSSGQMNWLNPDRYSLLIGGRWDSLNSVYYTANGKQIRPSTAEWNTYFGDLQPSNMNILFQSGRSFNDVFGWITPQFFTTWTVWRQPVTRHVQIIVPSNLSPSARQLFLSGNINWLTPGRAQMLQGGQWTGYEFVTKNQVHVAPGSAAWSVYFGNADPSAVNTFFGGQTSFDSSYGWVVEQLRSVSGGGYQDSFPWDSIFQKTISSTTTYRIL